MLKNHLKIALRNLRRQKGYAALNLLGLVIGIASFLLLARFLHNELTYDRFHEEAENMYRLTSEYVWKGSETQFALIPGYADPLLEREVPEVEAAATLFKLQGDMVLRRGECLFTETLAFYTNADFTDVFTFPLLEGDPETMLAAPNSIVLTEPMARRYFGDEDPMGQPLTWIEADTSRTLTVTGLLASVPQNSHLQFDFLVSGNTMGSYWKDYFFAPDADPMVYVYFRTGQSLPFASLTQKVDAVVRRWQRHIDGEAMASGASYMSASVQPLTDVYFNATNQFEPTAGGTFLDDSFAQLIRKEQVLSYLVLVFTLVSILIACLGLVGLVGYVTEQKKKEIGIRKAMGASRASLVALINRRFSLALLVAFVLAIPPAWWGTQQWLANFAYRIDLQPLDFLITGVLILTITALTVSVQSFKAASANPVKSLRSE